MKKAYAEMILNTSKEAAVRVMAAERKAHKFEQDLLSVKEEAVRMLLRMKQMIDSKVFLFLCKDYLNDLTIITVDFSSVSCVCYIATKIVSS